MKSIKITIILIIILLILSNITFFTVWILSEQRLKLAEKNTEVNQINIKMLGFARLLVDTLLSGNKEISFDDRLKLENAVRGLNDQEILDKWQEFTKSDGSVASQNCFSGLLKILLKKISY